MFFELQKQRNFIAPPADFVQRKRIQENFVLHLHNWDVIVWYNSYGGKPYTVQLNDGQVSDCL